MHFGRMVSLPTSLMLLWVLGGQGLSAWRAPLLSLLVVAGPTKPTFKCSKVFHETCTCKVSQASIKRERERDWEIKRIERWCTRLRVCVCVCVCVWGGELVLWKEQWTEEGSGCPAPSGNGTETMKLPSNRRSNLEVVPTLPILRGFLAF